GNPKNGQRFSIAGWVQPPVLISNLIPLQAVSTGQLNSILTFYEIQNPQLESELQDIPAGLLRRVIIILTKSNRAQLIESADGDVATASFNGPDTKDAQATHPLLDLQPQSPYLLQQTMADPSGAPPQPGPNDVATAILRPKKS
ncbi:14768_t:CDS:2, partial [Acaulospora colombiana]